jgi:hypothetical protein
MGVSFISSTEGDVQQIVSISGHFTGLYCFSEGAPSTSLVFTLRANGSEQALTCTVAAGSHSGATTGASVSFSAGSLIDIALPVNSLRQPGSAALLVGP